MEQAVRIEINQNKNFMKGSNRSATQPDITREVEIESPNNRDDKSGRLSGV